jgi:hypothetical protein
MHIYHHIAFNTRGREEFVETIRRLGIEHKASEIPRTSNKLISFDIEEADARWPDVQRLLERYRAVHLWDTFFEDEEILSAEWLRMIPTFEHGYPQPEGKWIKQRPNYADFCRNCGTHRQVAPFRIKGEPRLGGHDFMTLFWGHPVLCTAKVFDEFEAAGFKGYERWDVILHKEDVPSKTLWQLYVPGVAGPGLLEKNDLYRETCPECGTVKYRSHLRGVMYVRREAIPEGVDFVRTHEWFGARSKAAYREILVSNRVARLVLEKGWKGVRFKVVVLED